MDRSVQGSFAEGAKIFGNNICLAVYPVFFVLALLVIDRSILVGWTTVCC